MNRAVPGRRWIPIALIAGAAALLIAGLARLFALRFSGGDVYPAYSTLRADPLGAKAYWEALGDAGVDASRHFRDLARARIPRATIYVCGMRWGQFNETEVDAWRSLLTAVEDGGRLVIAFAPAAPPDPELERIFGRIEESQRRRRPRDADADAESKIPPSLAAHLGVHVDWLAKRPAVPLVADRRADAGAQTNAAPMLLPPTLPWNTALTVAPDDAAWRTIYSVGARGAVLERTWGAGTIVVLGDAFLVSNEALAGQRHTALLVWLQGAHRRAVFDESHLGVHENRGVATLARHYGLEYAAFALLVVALLFVWRNGTSLIPPAEALAVNGDFTVTGEAAGRETAAGFVNLLRRALAPRGLFAACLQEFRGGPAWRRLGADRQAALDQLGARAASATKPADVLAAMREAHTIVARRS